MIDRRWLKSLIEAGRAHLLETDAPLAAVDSAFLIRRAGVRSPLSEAERLLLLGLAADITEKGARHHHADGHASAATRALAHLRAHSRAPAISRSIVAETQRVSSSWLGHRLKQETGKSFTEHLTDARLTDARDQLGASGVSVKEAALIAGFPSANAFTKFFRRRYGMTPTAWRKAQSAKRKAQKGQ